jgi:hypothetical protein
MDPQFLRDQAQVRDQLRDLVDQMATLAQQSLIPLANDQQPNMTAAHGWLERAEVVARLVESLSRADSERIVTRFPWRLERRTDL